MTISIFKIDAATGEIDPLTEQLLDFFAPKPPVVATQPPLPDLQPANNEPSSSQQLPTPLDPEFEKLLDFFSTKPNG